MQNSSGKSSGPQKKDSLKSKLDGNELDLSMSSMDIVPVKELATIPKATILDLSCNLLTSLGDDFAALTHLVKLDLSKNKLQSLPYNFGELRKLQHLDLYNNSLSVLPLSFARLSALKWLDLRDNPLDPALSHQAGECLNETQCRTCAKQVVEFMKRCESEAERVRQRRLQEEREKEALRKREEEQEKQRAQQLKKAERERKKQEQAANRQQAAANSAARSGGADSNGSTAGGSTDESRKSRKTSTKGKSEKGGGGCLSWLLDALVMVTLFAAGVALTVTVYCWIFPDSGECNALYEVYWPRTVSLVRLQLDQAWNLTSLAYNKTLELIGQKTV